MKRFKVKINKDYCKGCMLCVHFCPKGVFCDGGLAEGGYMSVVSVKSEENCIGCKLCITVCPDSAIEISERNSNE